MYKSKIFASLYCNKNIINIMPHVVKVFIYKISNLIENLVLILYNSCNKTVAYASGKIRNFKFIRRKT